MIENIHKYIKRLRRTEYFGSIVLALATLCVMALQSCSDDMVTDVNGDPVEEYSEYNIILKVFTPAETATKSSTTDDDENLYSSDTPENATEDESALTTVTIYFCVNNIIKTFYTADYVAPVSNGASSIRINLGEGDQALSGLTSLVGTAEQKIQIFVVANTGDATGFNPTGIAQGNDIKEAKFSMSSIEAMPLGKFGESGHIMPLMNAKAFEVPIDGTSSDKSALDIIKGLFDRRTQTIAWWDIEDDSQKTTLELERGVARLEYKDVRPSTTNEFTSKANVFEIEQLSGIYLQLYSMAPFNVNSQSYLFKHTAPGNLDEATGAPNLLGHEKDSESYEGRPDGYNWIAAPDWTFSDGVYTFGSRTLYNPLSLSRGEDEYYVDEASLVNHNATGTVFMKDLDAEGTYKSSNGYYPWCYVSENTLYSTELMKSPQKLTDETTQEDYIDLMVAKYATGVTFKFILLDKEGNPLQYEAGPAESVVESGEEEESKYPENVANSVTDGNENWITITDPTNGKWVDVKPETVTIIDNNGEEKEITAYCLNYIACIVHNEPPEGKDYAPMQYGIVRNNTYQMSINKVEYIPLPQDPKTYFLQLNVKVQPWNKHEVEFEF